MDKQRERLVELLEEADQKVQEYILENDHMDWIPKPKELAEVRSDYLLANGVIVPPCKVGDVVYTYDYFDYTYKLRESTVRAIKIQKNEMTNVQEFLIEYFYIDNLFSWTNQGMFGKNVFLTKEEAEEALGGVQ